MSICERCGCEHDGSYGSGRFCSRSCANKRVHNSETRLKISNSIKEHNKSIFGESYVNNRERRKYIKKKENLEFFDMVSNSYDMEFVRYPGIDFGNKYVVTRNGEIISFYTKHVMSTIPNKRNDYVCVCLMDVSGKQHSMYVHRLVAIAFIPNPNNYPIINHKDENPSNNNVDNLEWCLYHYNNTYNNAHLLRGKRISETLKIKGVWNKGKKIK